MLKDITIGQFFPGDSIIHRLDARMKLIVTFAAIIEIFVCRNFYALALTVVYAVAAVLLSKIKLKVIFRGLRSILFIILFTSILQIFYNSKGDTLFEWWKIKITTGGLIAAAFMVIRIVTLILISSLLTYTTSPTTLTDAIERVLSPLKKLHVPVGTLAMMMTIALRFIPTLVDEVGKIMNAQKARGADLDTGSVIQRAKALIPIFVPLFVNSFRRAYELAFAMECRCYSDAEHRTRLKVMKLHARDFGYLGVDLLLLGGIIALNILFGKQI